MTDDLIFLLMGLNCNLFCDVIKVHEKPVITSTPVEMEGVESESVTFQCSASGKPPPEYEWVNGRGQPLENLERHTVDKYVSILLLYLLLLTMDK